MLRIHLLLPPLVALATGYTTTWDEAKLENSLPLSRAEGTAKFAWAGTIVSPVSYLDLNLVFDLINLDTESIVDQAREWFPTLKIPTVTTSGETFYFGVDDDERESKLVPVSMRKTSLVDAIMGSHPTRSRPTISQREEAAAMRTDVNDTIQEIFRMPLQRLEQAKLDLSRSLQLGGREERSVLAFLAGGIITAVGSAIFGSSDVSDVQAAAAKNTGMIETLAHGQEETLALIQETRDQHMTETVMLELARELANKIDLTALNIERLVAASYDLRQGRIDPSLVPPAALEAVRRKILKHCKEHGMREVLDPVKEIFRAPVSYIVTDKGWVLTLHIPLVKNEKVMVRNLYHFRSAAFTLKDGEDRRLVKILPDHDYISITRGGLQHAVHRDADFNNCFRVDKVLFCESNVVLHKKPHSCVAHLYLLNTEEALQVCKQEMIDPSTPLLELGRWTFMLNSKEASTVSCPNRDLQYIQPNGSQIISLQPGCDLTTAESEVYSNANQTAEKLIHADHFLSFPARESQLAWQTLMRQHEATVAAIDGTASSIAADANGVEVEARTLGQHLDSFFGGHSWIAPILIVVITTLFLYLGQKCYQHFRHQHHVDDHQTTNISFITDKDIETPRGRPNIVKRPRRFPLAPRTPKPRPRRQRAPAGSRTGGVCQGPTAGQRSDHDSNLITTLSFNPTKPIAEDNEHENPDAIHVISDPEDGEEEQQDEDEGGAEVVQETNDSPPEQQQAQAAHSPLLVERYGVPPPSREDIRREQATPLMVHQYGTTTSTPKK